MPNLSEMDILPRALVRRPNFIYLNSIMRLISARTVLFIVLAMTFAVLGHWISSCTDINASPADPIDGHSAYVFNKTLYEEVRNMPQQEQMDSVLLDNLNLEVRAIFAHKCYQCHSRAKSKGDLALETREQVMRGGGDGEILIPGDSRNSRLVQRLELPRGHEDAMPPKGNALLKEEIQMIKWWIDHGAHWSEKAFKQFRAAPLALSLPSIPDHDYLDHPVDIFVDQHFSQHRITRPTPIDDRRFIRRAYLDLHGLLPDFPVIEQFVNDPRPDKRSLLIDDLLRNREAFTAHWMSFWNDLLRNDYRGIGYIEGGRKQISDWLHDAILNNKPYDEFVAEIVNPTEESEGFIKGIQWRGVVNASQRSELQAAQNISQTFLGLNLKCASCHNSFVNNVMLDEAYAFANVFSSEPLEIFRCDKATGRYSNTAFIYPELGEVVGDSLKDRLASLAGIMVQPANGRLYRTIVNRFWDRLFGRGLIAPVDEMDKMPWNQDLLDWLAAKFIAKDFDLDWLLRTLMTSETYQWPAVEYPSDAYLLSSEFVFRGPVARRLTAEQFVDVFSASVVPIYSGIDYDPDHREMKAQWIWHKEIELDRVAIPKPGTRYLRKVFRADLDTPLKEATLLITVDDKYVLYLNEQKISEGHDWRDVKKISVPVSILKEANCIAIEAENSGVLPNEAGVLLALEVMYDNGDTLRIYSDQSWKTNDRKSEGWLLTEFDDSSWEDAQRYGSFGYSHWGKLPEFTFDPSPADPFIRSAYVKKDLFTTTLNRPMRDNVTTKREEETTLLQALMLTNSAFFMERISQGAEKWYARFGDDLEGLTEAMFQQLLGRSPSDEERLVVRNSIGQSPTPQDIADLIWTVVLLPEFQFI